jgi:hypothetical protein
MGAVLLQTFAAWRGVLKMFVIKGLKKALCCHLGGHI